ncbi:diguanylate cyclase (GGDEF) domain-containing protein [Pseudoxanthomonas sp. GM95]|uniref:GGDEF domain-containing protein n=1 Tax=Pseudoxanthomonas sp. GM95 TaxID=1881043 RepID=UPI0008D3391A|nr:GGDEF domain-containing protein [Pseudoxanthomonas sp. GM95]SEK78270.1 diguanylate cyclase (GGDEF) domain-containing protein [Pseudoxanthomonas sp. GM95]
MRWLNGRVDDLAPEQRQELIAQQREQSRRYVVVLFLSMPMLFLIGGLRELVQELPLASKSLPLRLALSALMVALGLAIQRRLLGENVATLLAILGIAAISVGTVFTVQIEPARMSLVHVVLMLVALQVLPLTIRIRDTFLMAAVLIVPLVGLMAWHQVPMGIWGTSLGAVTLGVIAGLFMRRQRLEIALELFELRHQLEMRADVDMLTGLLNREGWFRNARELFTLTRDTRKPMAVAYLDLDYFKRINDELGHAAGDRALSLVADVMRRHTRRQDIVGRLGGEEFVLLMPGLLEQPALRIVQDLCDAVRAISFQRPITFSAGLSQVRTTEHLEDAMRRADQALLQAKRDGRDRILRAS